MKFNWKVMVITNLIEYIIFLGLFLIDFVKHPLFCCLVVTIINLFLYREKDKK